MQQGFVCGGGLKPKGNCTTSGAVDTGVAEYTHMVIGSVQGDGITEFTCGIGWTIPQRSGVGECRGVRSITAIFIQFPPRFKSTLVGHRKLSHRGIIHRVKNSKVGRGTCIQVHWFGQPTALRSSAPRRSIARSGWRGSIPRPHN